MSELLETYYPRVLVICNNSFSLGDSNGRTLRNYFIGWPKEKLAQFCIMTDGPAFDVCNNYYCVSDTDVLKNIINHRIIRRNDLKEWKRENCAGSVSKKNTITVILRHIVWKLARWNNKELQGWLNDFDPEAILYMNGDSIFMSDFARKVSSTRKIPLIIYNSEGYYFFKRSYFRNKSKIDFVLFPLFQSLYRRSFEKLMKQSSFCIYLNSLLKKDYDNIFKDSCSEVLYSSSSIVIPPKEFNIDCPVFSYSGSLGLGRADTLIKLGALLHSINPSYELNIYGKPLSNQMECNLKNSEGIIFHGSVPYNKVLEIIYESDVLVHAESFDPKWSESNRYGFSTKIPDSLRSNRPFLIFSPQDVACYEYINTNKVGWCSHDTITLKTAIENIINRPNERCAILNAAKEVCTKNHDTIANSEKMKSYLLRQICIKKKVPIDNYRN